MPFRDVERRRAFKREWQRRRRAAVASPEPRCRPLYLHPELLRGLEWWHSHLLLQERLVPEGQELIGLLDPWVLGEVT